MTLSVDGQEVDMGASGIYPSYNCENCRFKATNGEMPLCRSEHNKISDRHIRGCPHWRSKE